MNKIKKETMSVSIPPDSNTSIDENINQWNENNINNVITPKQRWGLIIADPNDLHELWVSFIKTVIIDNTKFIHYLWKDIEIIAVESGIGIVNAAIMTQKLIDNYKVTKILNYGSAGGSSKVKLFDIIIPRRFYFHDVVTPWYSRGQIPNEKPYYINALPQVDSINVAGGNSFIYKNEQLELIKKDMDVDLFDMESLSIAQVSSKNNIPFFNVKCVSDLVGHTNVDNQNIIEESFSVAGKKAFTKLFSLFEVIKNQ